ncbi:MAG TPA: hypothetical protein VK171_12500 [Fimbriimonas sp.]|nr:hypothetical protein [Fimbriimonas sp.]
MIKIGQLEKISPVWGRAIVPTLADALEVDRSDSAAYRSAIKKYFRTVKFPTPEWLAGFEVIKEKFPSRQAEVEQLALRLSVCAPLADLAYRHAGSITDFKLHEEALYAATVLWENCTDYLGFEQKHLDHDHVLTCYGVSVQGDEHRGQRDEMLKRVVEGEDVLVYRTIHSHSSRYTYAHAWMIDPPSREFLISIAVEEAIAHQYGIPGQRPPVGFKSIVTAKLTTYGPWILQPSIPMGDRKGGALEVLTSWGATEIIRNEDMREFLFRLRHSF